MTLCVFFLCVFLFNEFLLIQLILLLLLFFVVLASDYVFVLLNSVLFLVVSGLLLWLLELDVYVNFLMVIDLGVFFVLIALLVNFISLFQSYNSLNPSFIFFLLSLSFFFFLKLQLVASPSNLMHITFYNWFSIYSLNYFTDLQILSDVYYLFNSFEFIYMNFYLYLTIFAVYLYFNLKRAAELNLNLKVSSYLTHGNSSVLMKQQDFHKQAQQLSTVRVWGRFRVKRTSLNSA